LFAGGFVSNNLYPNRVDFGLIFPSEIKKTRYVSINSTAQWGVGAAPSAATGVGVNIYVNGTTCGHSEMLGSGVPIGLRISNMCIFKISPGSTPSVVIQHLVVGSAGAYLSVNEPNAPMITFVTTSY
jgi:hypothetical protein